MCQLIFFLSLISAFPTGFKGEQNDVVNTEVYSHIDLKNQFAFVQNKIIFENKGLPVVTSYHYIVNEAGLYHITFFNENGEQLNHVKKAATISNSTEFDHYEVTLDVEVSQNKEYTFKCKIIYPNKILPATEQRKWEEDQLMKFESTARFFSMYETEFSEIAYFFSNDSLVEVNLDPTDLTDGRLLYAFYNTESYNREQIEIIFINNNAFLVIKSLHRSIQVNNFGKILIEDEVIIENNGPKFTGPFTTVMLYKTKAKAVQDILYTHLPASAENIELFDILGNNSQTRIHRFIDYITLQLKTRYVLLGGWKSTYNIRYEVPTYEYLYRDRDYYLLKIRAIDYVIDGVIIEKAVVKIILPEGASLEKIEVPHMLTFRNEEFGCPFGFCAFGRPIVVLNGTDLFENYIAQARLVYHLNPWSLLLVPFVFSVYLEVVFVVVLLGKYVLS